MTHWKNGLKEVSRMSKDTIYRQDAIDLFDVPDADGMFTSCGYAMRELRKLPSAQTEIIRCKDCKHFEYDHPYIIQGVPVLGHEVCNAWGDGCKTDENGYCFMAERRTDG